MSEKNGQGDIDKDLRVLKAMKRTLTAIIKDTTTTPGLKHPLSDATREDIRQCLILLTTREQELLVDSNLSADMRPGFTDEPTTSVVVPISQLGNKKGHKKTDN